MTRDGVSVFWGVIDLSQIVQDPFGRLIVERRGWANL